MRVLQPLARRMTAAITLLLCVVIGSMLWLAHRRVIAAVIDAELSRMQASANQLATALHASARRLIQESGRLATAPELVRAATGSAAPADVEAARRLLIDERRRVPQILSIAVWNANGQLILSEGSAQAAKLHPPGAPSNLETANAPSAVIGQLDAIGDTVSYAITAPLGMVNGARGGAIVVTRRMATGTESAALLGGLVGRGARILIGNADGAFWTDFARPVPGPTHPPAPGVGGEYRNASGTDLLAAVATVGETPWLVVVDIPRGSAAHAASRFALEMLIIAALFILAGALVSWYVVRRAMRPLEHVTRAAEAMALGDYSRRVEAKGFDEIGVLGRTYNVMAERVARSAGEIASRAQALEISNEDLHESEQRYRGLFEHLPDGILVHRDMRILLANPASRRLLGVDDVDGLLGAPLLEVVAPNDRDKVRECIEAMASRQSPPPSLEVRLMRPDGKHVVVEATSMPLTVDGEPAIQTIMRDVTERQLLEEQLRQSQKMDAVGRLAGGIAHDFNNLLTVIQAHSEFALSEDESPEERRADLEEIRRAADSAGRLTRQLLTFSRKGALSPAHIDLNESIGGILAMVKRLLGENIEISTATGSDLRAIWADPGQIEQVLLNLAVNARDAMPDGGRLRFETANVTIGEGYLGASASVIPAGTYVMLAVQDTGTGMTEEVRTRVFEPFFTTKQPGHGTGLGLSTVYGIIKQSHGHIWVYSEPNMGTTFKVFFPPYRSAPADPEPIFTGEHRASGAHANILIVEDEPLVRAAVSRALTQAGFTITEATHAGEALEALKRDSSINLMITDMVMPGKSGVELVGDARLTRPDLPVIILSGYSEATASQDWRVPERAAFLEKPVGPLELIRRVRQFLDGA